MDTLDTKDDLDLSYEQEMALLEDYQPTPSPSAPPQLEQDLRRILREKFKMEEFRPKQLEAIQAVLQGRDCFVRMATGSGKSLLWQLPALLQGDITRKLLIIIYPTKSLLIDQMVKLYRTLPDFVPVCYHGDLPKSLRLGVLEMLNYHHCLPHALLTIPECLSVTNELREKIRLIHEAGKLGRFVLDEADKVLDWGDSFREAYIELATALRETFHSVPILALSGSATAQDIQRTIVALGRHDVVQISDSLDRPNLFYEVREKLDFDNDQIVKDIAQLAEHGQGIVYCATHRDTARLGHRLRNLWITTEEYTSKVVGEEGKNILESWKAGKTQVVVATTAFGMGIGETTLKQISLTASDSSCYAIQDKADVRWVVHYTIPSSIEEWVQASGRAGRDGEKAKSIIYFNVNDVKKVQKIISKGLTDTELKERWKRLHQLADLIMDCSSCRRKRLLAYFGDDYPLNNCGSCDCCVAEDSTNLNMIDVTTSATNALSLLTSMVKGRGRNLWTRNHLKDAIRGKENTSNRCYRHGWEHFGCQLRLEEGKPALKKEIEAFISTLIHEGLVEEYSREVGTKSGNRFSHIYIKAKTINLQPSPKAEEFLKNPYKIFFVKEITYHRKKSPKETETLT